MPAVCRKELNKTSDPPPAAPGPGEPTLSPPPAPEQTQGPSPGGEAGGGGAGLTGFIQSALNQVFGGTTWSTPSQNHTSKLRLHLTVISTFPSQQFPPVIVPVELTTTARVRPHSRRPREELTAQAQALGLPQTKKPRQLVDRDWTRTSWILILIRKERLY